MYTPGLQTRKGDTVAVLGRSERWVCLPVDCRDASVQRAQTCPHNVHVWYDAGRVVAERLDLPELAAAQQNHAYANNQASFAHLPPSLVYPSGTGGRVLERDHVAHVERHDVIELDALVRRGGAQPLPVPRHLRHVICQPPSNRSEWKFRKLICDFACKLISTPVQVSPPHRWQRARSSEKVSRK